MNLADAKRRVDEAFWTLLGGPERRQLLPPLPESITSGKLYEAFVLAKVAERLASDEGFELRLVNANYLPLKTSPGPVNRRYPHIELRLGGTVRAEMWTDVEFLSLSYSRNGAHREPTRGEFHELDIMVVQPSADGHPSSNSTPPATMLCSHRRMASEARAAGAYLVDHHRPGAARA